MSSTPSAIFEHALDLAAEVGVAGRVDDVDLHVLVADRDVLREDRDAALALLVVGVEHALGDLLVLAEHVGGLQQPVDQRGLAVVDVGDDGDVAYVVDAHDVTPMLVGPGRLRPRFTLAEDAGTSAIA